MSSPWLGRALSGDFREIEYRTVRLRNRLHFHLSPKGDRDRQMLFVIGHPRTGTVTLHTILLANEVNSCHTAGRWRTWRFDAFGDRGNFQPFRLLDACYPNSWFILNTRPAFRYVRSLFSHWYSRRLWNIDPVRGRITERGVRGEILRRNQHFVDVVRYFEGRDNLLVLDIEEPGALDFLCERLGLENPGSVWENRGRAELPAEYRAVLGKAFEGLGIAGQRMNPFIFRSLLEASDVELVDRFLSRHRDRVHLSERWIGEGAPGPVA